MAPSRHDRIMDLQRRVGELYHELKAALDELDAARADAFAPVEQQQPRLRVIAGGRS